MVFLQGSCANLLVFIVPGDGKPVEAIMVEASCPIINVEANSPVKKDKGKGAFHSWIVGTN